MSTDAIKSALIAAYPNTAEKQWKRRSKVNVANGVERVFENTVFGLTVSTIEGAGGVISIGGDAPAQAVSNDISVESAVETPAVQSSSVSQKSKTVPLRNQMVVGSKWRITKEVKILVWVENPAFSVLIQDHYRDRNGPKQAALLKMIENGEKVVQRHVATIPAGAEFTVVGKIKPSDSTYEVKKHQTNGLMVPVDIENITLLGSGIDKVFGRHQLARHGMVGSAGSREYVVVGYDLPYNQIGDFCEPLEIPETLVYVLRDKATGLFFGGWKFSIDAYGQNRSTEEPKMVEKFSSAKKYATAAAVKASIRDFTGYNSGLDETPEQWLDGPAYYLAGGGKKMDLPDTWEMVSFDKPTATEKQTFDVVNAHKDAMRLRILTKNLGSAVRGVYKKAEGKGMQAIVVFQCRSRGSYNDHKTGARKNWDEASRFDDADDDGVGVLAAIKEATNYMEGTTFRERSPSTIAIAGSLVACIAARLAIDDSLDLNVKVLDFNTLEEIVEEQR